MKIEEVKEGMKVILDNKNLATDEFTVVKIQEDKVDLYSEMGYRIEGVKPELISQKD